MHSEAEKMRQKMLAGVRWIRGKLATIEQGLNDAKTNADVQAHAMTFDRMLLNAYEALDAIQGELIELPDDKAAATPDTATATEGNHP